MASFPLSTSCKYTHKPLRRHTYNHLHKMCVHYHVLALCQVIMHYLFKRSKHQLVHDCSHSATLDELWISRFLCWMHAFGYSCLCVYVFVLLFRILLSLSVFSLHMHVLHLHARLLCTNVSASVSLQSPGSDSVGAVESSRVSGLSRTSSSSAQRGQCAPPAPTIWPTHRMSASVSATAQNTSVWFPPKQPCHSRGTFCSHFK